MGVTGTILEETTLYVGGGGGANSLPHKELQSVMRKAPFSPKVVVKDGFLLISAGKGFM
jgi:hypothetical protein